MRHIIVNLFTYAIAAMIVVGSGFFARMRASQYVLTVEPEITAAYEPAPAHEFEWRELGPITYRRNCSNCHGRAGQGRDQYPPLAGAMALALRPGGREYLVDLHLYGVSSRRWGVPMPPMGHLQDVQIAAVLNHVLTMFGAAPDDLLFGPDDIAARRGRQLSPHDVERLRPGHGGGPRDGGGARRQRTGASTGRRSRGGPARRQRPGASMRRRSSSSREGTLTTTAPTRVTSTSTSSLTAMETRGRRSIGCTPFRTCFATFRSADIATS